MQLQCKQFDKETGMMEGNVNQVCQFRTLKFIRINNGLDSTLQDIDKEGDIGRAPILLTMLLVFNYLPTVYARNHLNLLTDVLSTSTAVSRRNR